jgi:hypothetical protein
VEVLEDEDHRSMVGEVEELLGDPREDALARRRLAPLVGLAERF